MIVGAVQQVAGAREALAVDQHSVGALRVLGRRWRQRTSERATTPGVISWKFVKRRLRTGSSVIVFAAVRRRRLRCALSSGASFGSDLDRLGHVAHLHLHVDASLRIDRNTDVVLNERLESGASTRTRYLPTIRKRCVKLPDSFEVVVAATSRPMSVIVTFAPVRTPPLASVTVPTMLP